MQEQSTLQTDICVIGAGAAGITLASEFAAGERDVCLVESGGLGPDDTIQSLYDLESTGYPLRENYMSRARYYGGSCNLWAGRSMVLNPLDFQPRGWVPYSGWPIAYDEVEKYYPRAAGILRVPQLPGVDTAYFRDRLSAAETRLLGGGPFAPTLSLWAKSAMRFGVAYRKLLAGSRNIQLLLNASATAVHLNENSDRVESIEIATLDGKRFNIVARVFVLACGGLENARLLLVSRDRNSAGIGNEHDMVGRFFMDHPRAVFGKVHVDPGQRLALLRGRPVANGKLQLGVALSPEIQERERLLNHYVTFEMQSSGYAEAKYQSFIQTMKVVMRRGYTGSRWDFARANVEQLPNMIYLLSPKELMPHALYRAYFAARQLIPRRTAAQTYVAVYFCEQPPDPASRVMLSESRDHLGVNRLQLNWRIGPQVTRSILRMQELLGAALVQQGIGRLEPAHEEEIEFTDASHHMGTTRMGVDPKDSVVDVNCRVHGTANLYVAGSSVFPSAGHANPTLSIVALTLRLAEHLRACTK